MEKKTLPPRSDVPVEETWSLTSIFTDIDAWEVGKEQVLAEIPLLAAYKGRLAESPAVLGEFFDAYETALRLALRVMLYGNMEISVDNTNQEAQARAGEGQSVIVQLSSACAFLEPELMGIGFNTLRQWMTENLQLADLGHYIDELERQKEHIRSDEVEQVLAMAREPLSDFYRAYNAIVNADLKFQDATAEDGRSLEVGQSSINSLITHKDRKVRQTGFENYADGYLAFKNTIAAIQVGGIHNDVFNARSRNYGSSLSASLANSNIPTDVFYALIETFKKHLPTWHRYWKVRKEALKLDKFHVYDIKAPLSENSPDVPFEQAIGWICEGMAPLGEEYVAAVRKGALEDRWVDRARNKGKRLGAFSSGVYDTNPFVMMSYANDVFSLSTLAHELGHSMHSLYSRKHQPFIYSHYSLFVAEVASNFNQAMVRDYLFKTQTDPAFQLALIEEAMSNFHRYFFIMPTLARWELAVHERAEAGKPLTADIMTDMCANLFGEGYGDGVVYDHDRVGITWAQFQHMYMNFYVYQYATGISAAHALAKGVQEGGPAEVERYLGFLSAGGSVYPLEALKAAGVDMTSSEPVEKAFEVMASYVDRLDQLVKAGEV
ncbi:oligoendopeptidase F (plasmid) [Chloroflexota bacterium]|nr:oligoendopeptidase F [Chloroflexota bacterium]